MTRRPAVNPAITDTGAGLAGLAGQDFDLYLVASNCPDCGFGLDTDDHETTCEATT